MRMTPRRALWIAASASLLIQVWFIGMWWWMSAGCFCSVGPDRDLSGVTIALVRIATFPVDHIIPLGYAGYHPLTLGLSNFYVWFAAFYLLLRMGMLAAGVRRPERSAA